jgi:hypothetical protein
MRNASAGATVGVSVAVLPGGTVKVAVRVAVVVGVWVAVPVTVPVAVGVPVCVTVRVMVTVGVGVGGCRQALDGPLIRIWLASFLTNGELGGAKRPQ